MGSTPLPNPFPPGPGGPPNPNKPRPADEPIDAPFNPDAPLSPEEEQEFGLGTGTLDDSGV